MSNSYVVSNCTYDGTSGSANPLCTVTGAVNGKNVYALAFFSFLMSASSANLMQQALSAIMFNYYADVYAFQNPPWPNPIPFPTFPASNAVATHPGDLIRLRWLWSARR
jgi:hypothetical protein